VIVSTRSASSVVICAKAIARRIICAARISCAR
jgi:hypothetical protein